MRILFLLTVSSLMFQQPQVTSAAEDFANTNVQQIHIDALGIPAALREVSRQTHVTIGLEMDVVMGTESRIIFDFPGGTISDLAKRCTSLVEGASWKIMDGRSIVIVKSGKASLLSRARISYPGVENATRQQVWSDLSNRPEIGKWLHDEGCSRLALLSGHEWRGDTPTITIPKAELKLEDILDRAASSASGVSWSVLQNSRDGQCEIIITLW
jgi:hypothetical protein